VFARPAAQNLRPACRMTPGGRAAGGHRGRPYIAVFSRVLRFFAQQGGEAALLTGAVCYFVIFSNSAAAELMSSASEPSTLPTSAMPSSACFHFFCSMDSRTAGMVLTP